MSPRTRAEILPTVMSLPAAPPLPGQNARRSSRLGGALAVIVGAAALVAVVAVVPSPLFDLDRFSIPKELVLHLTATICGILLLSQMRRVGWTVVDVLLLSFLLWSMISAAFSTNHWLALRSVGLSVSGAVLYWAGRRIGVEGRSTWLQSLLAFAVVAGALTGLAQAYGLELPFLATIRAPGGTFGNRNFMAHLMAIAVPVLIRRGIGTPRKGVAVVSGVALAIVSAAIVLSRSRAAWLAVSAGVATLALGAAIAWLRNSSAGWSPRVVGLLTAAALGTGAALVLPNQLEWRSRAPYKESLDGLFNYREGSGRGRLIQYQNSLKLVARHPVFGVGPGNWPVHYPLVTTPGDPSFSITDPMPTNPWPSSDWVALLTERGPLAVLLLLAAGAAACLTAARRLGRGDANQALAASTTLAVLMATLIAGAFDAVLLLPLPIFFVSSLVGSLLPETGAVLTRDLTPKLHRQLIIAGVLLGVGLVARSSTQLAAILTARSGESTPALLSAARFDPSSFRLQLLLASRFGCPAGAHYARDALDLFPHHAAPARWLSQCRAGP